MHAGEEQPSNTFEVEVSDDVAAYLREWADAVGCEPEDVAADSIEQFVEGYIDDD